MFLSVGIDKQFFAVPNYHTEQNVGFYGSWLTDGDVLEWDFMCGNLTFFFTWHLDPADCPLNESTELST